MRKRTAAYAATLMGCEPGQVLVASTGVIGHQLPMDRIEIGLEQAVPLLGVGEESFRTAALSIMTTDTRPKIVSESRIIGGREGRPPRHRQGGRDDRPAHGDHARVPPDRCAVWANDLRDILVDAVDRSFNCLSVEGHASTNDTVLILSSTAAVDPTLRGEEIELFVGMVRSACEALAKDIADDGEGATHFITIDVEGCQDTQNARAIARAVAESPLVKTAIHGADPNWGRIVSAAGYAGVPFQEEELSLWINGVPVYQGGAPVPFDAAGLSESLKKGRAVDLRLTLNSGPAAARFWTCDLTADYVRLNADYTT